MSTNQFLIIAGESSADLHAAHLVNEIKKTLPEATFFGMGSQRLYEAGVELIARSEEVNLVGIQEVVERLPSVLRVFNKIVSEAKRRKPTAAILLDLPDFNLKMAKKLKKAGITVIYYISPQVWVWRKYRVSTIRKYVDKMLVLFPFEKEFYRERGVEAEWVGHPLIDELTVKNNLRTQAEIGERPKIGLFPGSRPSEIKFHGPLLKETVFALLKKFPNAQFKLAVANTLSPKNLESFFDPGLIEYSLDSRKVLKWADCAMIASGTATLEAAVVGLPFCLFYQVSWLNDLAFRWVVRYDGPLGMANVLMKRNITQEFFQAQATPEALVAECSRMITEEKYRNEMKKNLLECRNQLNSGGGSQRAAQEVISVLNQKLPRQARGSFVLSPQNT